MTGVSECSQQRGNLKDNRYRMNALKLKRRLHWLRLSVEEWYCQVVQWRLLDRNLLLSF
ncbi:MULTISPECIES: hypothetical protein [Photorhabdus]|uniref:hypothetical protein n=1 Tax=Photorhabdus TaxID=29487 RepID=UPI001473AC83|nr:hypothetical protein [Photorhabdus asymbiotica]